MRHGTSTPRTTTAHTHYSAVPPASGLYDPAHEHDACGLAMLVRYRGDADHTIVEQALSALRNMEHRGAVGGDSGSGDGAGITVQIPDAFFRCVFDAELPPAGTYAVGTAFLDPAAPQAGREIVAELAAAEGMSVLGWREVPTALEAAGVSAREVMPRFEQVALALSPELPTALETTGRIDETEIERRAFAVRKRAEHAGIYFPSLSARTITYKGMLTTAQLAPFYPDLTDERFTTRIALVHSRFSTTLRLPSISGHPS